MRPHSSTRSLAPHRRTPRSHPPIARSHQNKLTHHRFFSTERFLSPTSAIHLPNGSGNRTKGSGRRKSARDANSASSRLSPRTFIRIPNPSGTSASPTEALNPGPANTNPPSQLDFRQKERESRICGNSSCGPFRCERLFAPTVKQAVRQCRRGKTRNSLVALSRSRFTSV